MNATHTQSLLLVIDRPDGHRWTLSLSRDAARFVGFYARVPGIGDADGLLRFAIAPGR